MCLHTIFVTKTIGIVYIARKFPRTQELFTETTDFLTMFLLQEPIQESKNKKLYRNYGTHLHHRNLIRKFRHSLITRTIFTKPSQTLRNTRHVSSGETRVRFYS